MLATNAGVSLVAGPIAGALVDRVGGKRMLTVALGFLTLGFAGYAFVESPWQGFLASAVTGIGNGAFWPSQSTLLAGLTTRAQRSATFAMQRVVMNLGIGLGGVAGGFIATESFRALFLLDALTFVAYAAVLTVFVHEPVHTGGACRALRQLPHRLPPQGLHGADGRQRALHRGRDRAARDPARVREERGRRLRAGHRLALLHQHARRRAAAAADDAPARGQAARAVPRADRRRLRGRLAARARQRPLALGRGARSRCSPSPSRCSRSASACTAPCSRRSSSISPIRG